MSLNINYMTRNHYITAKMIRNKKTILIQSLNQDKSVVAIPLEILYIKTQNNATDVVYGIFKKRKTNSWPIH